MWNLYERYIHNIKMPFLCNHPYRWLFHNFLWLFQKTPAFLGFLEKWLPCYLLLVFLLFPTMCYLFMFVPFLQGYNTQFWWSTHILIDNSSFLNLSAVGRLWANMLQIDDDRVCNHLLLTFQFQRWKHRQSSFVITNA